MNAKCIEKFQMEKGLVSQSLVVQRSYDQRDLKNISVISGISPNTMRSVFGGWILFAAFVAIIITVAPNLSYPFIGLTLFVLVSFTLVIFWQSRISEGWPTIICDEGYIGIVCDPQKRSFLLVHKSIITHVTSTVIKPNKKAIQIHLDKSALDEQAINLLKQAVWPREDSLIGLVHFKNTEDVSARIMRYVHGKAI